jgi:uncharacterized protein YyaL (SSP411 family)
MALEEHLQPPSVVIVRGPVEDAARWSTSLARLYAPGRLVFAVPTDAVDLPPALASKVPQDTTVGYVCQGMTCSAPVRSLEGLVALTR